MSTQQSQHLRSLHLESLRIQREHMLVVLDRHQAWIQDTEDNEINRMRRDIIDLIEKTADQYDHLLEALQSQRTGEDGEAGGNKSRTARDWPL